MAGGAETGFAARAGALGVAVDAALVLRPGAVLAAGTTASGEAATELAAAGGAAGGVAATGAATDFGAAARFGASFTDAIALGVATGAGGMAA
jgi:hypothetical protein